jgi:hypothetical protein
MLRWLIRLGLLYAVTRLAREYTAPAAKSPPPRARPRKRKQAGTSSARSR